jgi:flavin reductase (DIM6/NTAB) family NADH-FMN oxidoreductase RutF
MKGYLTGKLFAGQPARQYITVAIADGLIEEKAFLHYDGEAIDVSAQQFVLCQVPFLIGVWLSRTSPSPKANVSLRILNHLGDEAVVIDMVSAEEIPLVAGNVWLFEIAKLNYRRINWVHQKLLLTYFQRQRANTVSYKELDGFCATYQFPRKVILTCHGDNDNYNLFPMDLQGFLVTENIFILGLRNSNVTLQEILKTKKVVVCDVDASHKEVLLSLGRHHSSKPPQMDELPFSWRMSLVYSIPIPNIANSYHELQIVHHRNLGSHTIMFGKVINTVSDETKKPSLYHLHTLYAMTQPLNYKPV